MDLEGIILREISQRCKLFDITYMLNIKENKLVNITKKKQTQSKLVVTSEEREKRGNKIGN